MKRAAFLFVFSLASVGVSEANDWWCNHWWSPREASLWHVTGGNYVLNVPYATRPTRLIYMTMLQEPDNDYEAAVDVLRISGTQADGVGLAWRHAPNRSYWLLIAGGTHYVVLETRPGEERAICPWHRCPYLLALSWNRLGIRAKAREHQIIINGHLDFSFSEDNLTTGGLALTACDTEPFEVQFRNFSFGRLVVTSARRWSLYR